MITLQLDPTLMGNPQIDALSNLILSFRKEAVSVKTGEIQMTVGDHAVEPYVMTGNESVAKLDVIADLQNQQDDHDATQSFTEQPYVDPYDISPATQAFAAVADVELDSAGQPWNAEIHSASKSKVADGTWRIKRGVKVEPTPVPAPPATVATAVPVPAAPTVVTPPPPVAAASNGNPTFDASVQGYVKLVQYTAGATHSGHISEPEIAMLCSQHGIASLALLTTKLDIVPTIGAQIVGIVASRAP